MEKLKLKFYKMACHIFGPIVTPSEAESLPVRITINCRWNRCEFCPVYKGKNYETIALENILKFIETSRFVFAQSPYFSSRVSKSNLDGAQEPRTRPGIYSGVLDIIKYVPTRQTRRGREYESAFLQDADAIELPTDDLIMILQKIKKVYPKITRITSYGRAYSLVRKSLEELKELHDAGLSGIYCGMESGYNALLRYMKKGTTKRGLIESGIKVKQAGIELSDFVMPGLGGNLQLESQETWRMHAEETAIVINEVNPDYIRLRTLYVHPSTPLWKKVEKGEFKRASNQDIVKEIRLFIEKLEGISSSIESNFISDIVLFEGRFPEDKEKIISMIDKYLEKPFRRDREYKLRSRYLENLF